MRNFFLALFFFSPFFGIGFAATLPPAVSAALKHARIPLSSVAIVVQEEHGNAPILSLNGQQAMNPASTMKLLTTFAALETLGPAYRWKTEAYLNGKLEKGVLQGDLVFKGYGDPKLTVEQLWMWLRELRQRGLRDIHGDIVLDHSFFETVHNDPAEFDHDPSRAYNVGTNALLLNFNAMHLHLIPDGHNTIALLEPLLAGYTLRNHITTTATLNCHGRDAYQARLDGRDIVLDGTIPEICGETDDYFSLLPQDEYFFAVFSALWQELGGTIKGTLRSGIVSAEQIPFSKYISPPLSEVIRDINKFSNNSMARQLFLTLGTANMAGNAGNAASASASEITKKLLPTENKDQGGDRAPLQAPSEPALTVASEEESADADLTTALDASAPSLATENNPKAGTVPINKLDMEPPVASILPPQSYPPGANIAGSIIAMQQWLKTQHLQFPELVLENGAGLSRKERISALHLAELLQHATRSPFYAELAASLPILGMDGTVKKRFKNSGLAGYAHLKTGSLQGVKSIAGYVKARSGKQWIMVFIVNHPNAALAPAAQDALIEWLQTAH
jgi:D-alanyl-D-alanine carboxypeptidase/D-alanyl-D-alanine-endopeptidase (penicillin-binding protein 4)